MNDTIVPPAAASAIFDAAPASAAKGGFQPHLVFYHPTASGKGAAIQFSVNAATPDQDGAVFFSIAPQLTAAGPAAPGEPRKFASFDWRGKVTVKLNAVEVAELLLVIAGAAPALAHAGKTGLFHNSPTATTTIEFKRSEDPARPGFLLGVGRTPKADAAARQFVSMALSVAEAYALRLALEQAMGLVAFGLPREPRAAREGACPRPAAAPAAARPPAPAPAMPPVDDLYADAI